MIISVLSCDVHSAFLQAKSVSRLHAVTMKNFTIILSLNHDCDLLYQNIHSFYWVAGELATVCSVDYVCSKKRNRIEKTGDTKVTY